jgi:hypothetical protein
MDEVRTRQPLEGGFPNARHRDDRHHSTGCALIALAVALLLPGVLADRTRRLRRVGTGKPCDGGALA